MIAGVVLKECVVHADDRGFLLEVLRDESRDGIQTAVDRVVSAGGRLL